MKFINPILTQKAVTDKLLNDFLTAQPYKHVVIDDFLKEDIALKLYENFPEYEIFNKKYDGLNERKAEGSNFEDFNPLFSDLKAEVSSTEFCKWVTQITGIDNVFVTNDPLGAGLHQGKNGSFLDIHIDFSMHHQQNVYRRLNLLIYFNKDWKEEYKGHTELWNADMTECVKKVRPDFNRAVIFQTTGKSYHGYGKINPPEGITRKSFYTYFYTNVPGEQDNDYHDTIFKARPEESSVKKIKTNIKESSKNFIKRQLKKFGIGF